MKTMRLPSSLVAQQVAALERSESVVALGKSESVVVREATLSLRSNAATGGQAFPSLAARQGTVRPLLRTAAIAAALLALGAGLFLSAVTAAELDEKGRQKLSQDTRAVIVVTGLILQEDAAGAVRRKDLAAAEGAVVRVTRTGGAPVEKRTALFGAGGPRADRGHFSADFLVDLDATYDIAMTFQNGTVIRIADYRLPKEWRTHFYFHSTRGTKSPASVLRIGRDDATGLACYVYAVFPLEAYRSLGGRQLP